VSSEAIRPFETLRRMRPADMTDAEYIALMEHSYRRVPEPCRWSLLEFTGMAPDEYAEWIMAGTVPERVMRVARRR
jgi:hypothetical protein